MQALNYAVAAAYGVFKQGDFRGIKCENCKGGGKGNKDQNGYPRPLAVLFLFKKHVFRKEYCGGGDKKGAYVKPVGRFAESSVCRVKQNRYKDKPQHSAAKLYPPKAGRLKVPALNDGKDKQGKKQKLHMLPSGFVNPGDYCRKIAFSCKFEQIV